MAESEKSKKKRLQKAINITEYQLDKKKEEFTSQEWRRVYILAQNFLSPHLQKKDLKKDASILGSDSLLGLADLCDSVGETGAADLIENAILSEEEQ